MAEPVAYETSVSATQLNNGTGEIFNTTTLTSEASPCPMLQFEGVPPWSHPENLVSAHTESLVHKVKYSVILPILFLIGGPANVINMAVFYRQGLKERINVCLFCLSLADFLNLFFNMLFYSEQMYLQLSTGFTTTETYGPLMRFMINNNLLAFYGFIWVSQIISAIIASERCLCVLWPLRSQTILSTTTVVIIIIITNILMVGLYLLVVSRYRAQCVHDPVAGLDLWILNPSLFYFEHQAIIDAVDGFVFGVILPLVTIAVVAVTTVVTMVKLRQAAAWRAGTSSSSSVSPKEVGVTVMLVYNSIFFVVCVFPLSLFRMVWLFSADLNPGGAQHNLYFTIIWLLDVLGIINATFNFVIYYTMGSRYRQVFWQIVCCTCSKSDKLGHVGK